MKEKMYKYAPVLLLSGGLGLWLITFLIARYDNYKQGLAWISLLVIQMVICATCGILIKELHQQVHTDTLTGLRNRRYFCEKLPELTSKAPISLILMDIDNFKSVNDTYGHMAGDQVLQQFAGILQSNTRKNDIIARLGGEEFAVILPQTDVKEAFKIANRIRTAVENHLFSYENITCKITVSVGIASVKECTNVSIDQFLKITE